MTLERRLSSSLSDFVLPALEKNEGLIRSVAAGPGWLLRAQGGNRVYPCSPTAGENAAEQGDAGENERRAGEAERIVSTEPGCRRAKRRSIMARMARGRSGSMR